METPFKRSEWNGIIDDVNEISTNPENDCPANDTIPNVDECHIWTPSDIIQVQNAIDGFRDAPFGFTEPNGGDKWHQDILDEILDALAEGWTKDCTVEPPDDDCPCDPEGSGPPDNFPPRDEWPTSFCVSFTFVPDPSPDGGAPVGTGFTTTEVVPSIFAGPPVNLRYTKFGDPQILLNFNASNQGNLLSSWAQIRVTSGQIDGSVFVPDPSFDETTFVYSGPRNPITLSVPFFNIGLLSNDKYKDSSIGTVTITGC